MAPSSAKAGPAITEPHDASASLTAMRSAAEECTRCDLYRNATRLVFGEGPARAKVILIGEQPGDREDLAGRPFVGPAGHVLDQCLHEAGIDRSDCYLTNAVKHFKFEQRGKRRLHVRPNAGEIQRCAWWLGGELERLKPKLAIALGATAVYSLFGRSVSVMKARGRIIEAGSGIPVLIKIHPSYLLRIPDKADAEKARATFITHLAQTLPYLNP